MHPLINLLHLKFFCDAVDCNSISESAKINYVTQSTVSQAIVKLERILKTKIIVHSRQKFQVTEEGKILFEQARHIFKAVQNIHDKIHQNSETIVGNLKFACTNSLAMSFIALAYKQMQQTLPHVQMTPKLGNLNFIRQALRQNEVEFALVVYDQNFSQFAKHPLRKGFFHLYQHTNAPLHQIESGILVDSVEGTYVSELQEFFLRSHDQPLKIQAELAGWEVVARFTEKNIGIGFFPDYLTADDRYPTIKKCSIEYPPLSYEICAIYNKGERLSRAANAFLDLFQ